MATTMTMMLTDGTGDGAETTMTGTTMTRTTTMTTTILIAGAATRADVQPKRIARHKKPPVLRDRQGQVTSFQTATRDPSFPHG